MKLSPKKSRLNCGNPEPIQDATGLMDRYWYSVFKNLFTEAVACGCESRGDGGE